MATMLATREYLRLAEKDGLECGHIININSSLVGHVVTPFNTGLNFCTATKHMLRALTEALHTELATKQSSKIRVTVRAASTKRTFQQQF